MPVIKSNRSKEHSWRRGQISIVFRLGEVHIYSWTLSALIGTTHLGNVITNGEEPAMPIQCLSADVEALFFPRRPIRAVPATLERVGNIYIYTPETFQNFFVEFGAFADFASYLEKFGGKSRSTLMRKVRKFKEAWADEEIFREFRAPEELGEFFTLAGEISKHTYQERLLDSGLPRDPAFVARTKRRAESDGVIGWLLSCAGKPVAYVLSFIEDGVATYDYVGYLTEFHHLSPGTVLQFYILESLFKSRRVRMFDFTEGEGEHKRFFSTGSQLCAKTFVVRRSIRTYAMLETHRLLNQLVGRVGRALDLLGVKTRVRALIRRMA